MGNYLETSDETYAREAFEIYGYEAFLNSRFGELYVKCGEKINVLVFGCDTLFEIEKGNVLDYEWQVLEVGQDFGEIIIEEVDYGMKMIMTKLRKSGVDFKCYKTGNGIDLFIFSSCDKFEVVHKVDNEVLNIMICLRGEMTGPDLCKYLQITEEFKKVKVLIKTI